MGEALGKDTDAGLFGLPGEYTKVEKAIKVIERKTFPTIYVVPSDTIQFTFSSKEAVKRFWNRAKEITHYQRTVEAKRSMAVDTAMILEIKDEFGLEVGCGILIGESKK